MQGCMARCKGPCMCVCDGEHVTFIEFKEGQLRGLDKCTETTEADCWTQRVSAIEARTAPVMTSFKMHHC
jgi:hypothetical protein